MADASDLTAGDRIHGQIREFGDGVLGIQHAGYSVHVVEDTDSVSADEHWTVELLTDTPPYEARAINQSQEGSFESLDEDNL